MSPKRITHQMPESQLQSPPVNIEDEADATLEPEAPETLRRGGLSFTGESSGGGHAPPRVIVRENPSGGNRGGGGSPKMNIAQILVAAILAVVISVFLTFQLAPSKTSLSSMKQELQTSITSHTHVGYATDVDLSIEEGRVDALITSIANANYVTQPSLTTAIEAAMAGYSPGVIPDYDEDIAGLQAADEVLAADIEDVSAQIAALPASDSSGLDYFLTYSSAIDKYSLTAESSHTGTYIACLMLVYDPPVEIALATSYGDAVEKFYSSLAVSHRYFVCDVRQEGTKWYLTRAAFDTSPFGLTADTAATFNVSIYGLTAPYNSGYKVYVEVYPGSGTSTGGGGGI